jgi:hypothetical protein
MMNPRMRDPLLIGTLEPTSVRGDSPNMAMALPSLQAVTCAATGTNAMRHPTLA